MPDLQAPSSTIFITGATGFIGYHVTSYLLKRRYRVRAMVRPEKLPESRLPVACEQVAMALTDAEKMKDVISGCDAVIYCAGTVKGRSPADFSAANIDGIKVMANALSCLSDAPPLLLLSSLAASRPEISDYAQSKFQGEQVLAGKPELAWTILRPTAIYGPGDSEMLPILKMARRGLLAHVGPRDQRLSLLHVSDLASAVAAWLDSWQLCLHSTYSLDDGKPGGYNWQAFGKAVAGGNIRLLKIPRFVSTVVAQSNLLCSRLLGYAPMLTPGKVRELTQQAWLGDNRAFSASTGWQPKIDLKSGSRELFGA